MSCEPEDVGGWQSSERLFEVFDLEDRHLGDVYAMSAEDACQFVGDHAAWAEEIPEDQK